MIDVQPYLKKLFALQAYLCKSIDETGAAGKDFEEYYFIKHDRRRQLKEINKVKPVQASELVSITEHAYDRSKERLSINRTAFLKLAEKAYAKGKKHSDTNGHLNRYISKLFFNYGNANNTRIYGENVFLFCNERLITFYQLPKDLRKCALKLQAR